MNQTQNDDIDLWKLFHALWDGKWFITAFTLIAMLIGAGFIFFKEAEYESRLTFVIDNIPPFYQPSKIYGDFHIKFYSKENFENWKNINKKTSLTFDALSNKIVVNGIVISKGKGSQLAVIKNEDKKGYFILIKTNDFSILDSFYKYSQFINQLMNNQYVARAKDELKLLKLRFMNSSPSDNVDVKNYLSIDRFVVNGGKNSPIFYISHPTIPKKVSPRSRLILIFSVLFGGMLGVGYVLISRLIRNH